MKPKVSTRSDVARRLAASRLAAYQRRDHREERGQILVIFALSIVVIMLFASIVIDLGLLRNNRQILVNAVDAGALAGGTLMPVDACNNPQLSTAVCGSVNATAYQRVENLVIATMQATYPGIQAADYTISYRCLIGVDDSSQPYISRDIPLVCNPRGALGHTPVASDFKGAGPTRYSVCNPRLGDKCNVIVITGSTTTQYSFGRVVGVTQGSTGTTVSAACNGPCGQPPSAPVDLVVLLDRTASMSSSQIADARNALRAVLQVYDPSLQRVALGFLGPSFTDQTCSGTGGGPAVAVNAINSASPPNPTFENSTTGTTVSGGATSINVAKPGSLSNSDVLVAAITVNNSIRVGGSGNVVITPPAGWNHIRSTSNGTTVGVATYYKVITNTGSEPAVNYTWSFTNSGGAAMTVRATGAILHYNDVDTNDPLDVDGGNTGSDNSGTINAQADSITAVGNNNANIAVVGFANGTGGSANNYFGSWTNGSTERADQRGTNGAGPSLGMADRSDDAGSTGNIVTTVQGGGSYAAQQITLNPDDSNYYGTTYPDDLLKWIPIGFTGTDSDSPAQTYNEAYVDANGNLQNTTSIVSAINCFNNPGGTGTNLTTPIEMAAAYLQNFGRPNVKWGILFETDGEPSYSSTGDPGNYTCQSAVTAATNAKAITNADGKHIELFTVAFLDSSTGDPNCPDGSGTYSTHGVTKALKDMASSDLSPSSDGEGGNDCTDAENTDQDHFFCEPDSAELETVFQTIATEFAGVRSHMIQLCPAPVVTSISPSSGTRNGGTTVTVTGKYFTGTTSVRFGGTNGTNVTVNSDTSLTVRSPAGAQGTTVSVIVTTDPDCGSSLPGSGSNYTYT